MANPTSCYLLAKLPNYCFYGFLIIPLSSFVSLDVPQNALTKEPSLANIVPRMTKLAALAGATERKRHGAPDSNADNLPKARAGLPAAAFMRVGRSRQGKQPYSCYYAAVVFILFFMARISLCFRLFHLTVIATPPFLCPLPTYSCAATILSNGYILSITGLM